MITLKQHIKDLKNKYWYTVTVVDEGHPCLYDRTPEAEAKCSEKHLLRFPSCNKKNTAKLRLSRKTPNPYTGYSYFCNDCGTEWSNL